MPYLLQDSFFVLLIYTVSGMIFGSFATALVYRLPKNMDWIKKRSHCTKCNAKLTLPDLIPVFSYIINKGSCRHCGYKYGSRYFVIELIMAISFLLIGWHFGANEKSIYLCMMAFAIITLTVIDFEHYIIPDEINLFIFILGLVYQIQNDPSIEQILFNPLIYLSLALILRWIVYLWKKREGLGMGDVKFFVAAGIWLDIERLPVFLMFSGVAGIIIAVIWKISGKGKIFPFGPALSASLFFCVAFPELSVEFLYKFHNLIY